MQGSIGRNISVQLVTIEAVALNNSASPADYNNTVSVTYTFGAGVGVAERTLCASIPLNRDGIVENEEVFLVSLMEFPEEEDVVITASQAQVFIADSPSDSKESDLIHSGIGRCKGGSDRLLSL